MSAILAINGIKKELEGKRDQALFDLRIYLTSPVGVGEHSSLCEEVKNKINLIGDCDSLLDTIEKYIKPQEDQSAGPENAPVGD